MVQQSMICPDPTGRPEVALAVHLVTPLTLIAQAVGTALRSRGIRVEHDPHPGRRATHDPSSVLVVIDDLVTPEDVRRVLALLRSTTGPVLVLTGRDRGHYWGALVGAGACSIMSSAASLDELVCALVTVHHGGDVLAPEERDELVVQWDAFVRQQRDVVARLDKLTPRETLVLRGMRAGVTVLELSESLGLRQATVRSHVRSILRKLGVRSQLAAVAMARGLESPLVAGGTQLTQPRGPGSVAPGD